MSVRLEMWTSVTVCALAALSMALALGDFVEASNSVVTVAALLELIVMSLLMLQHAAWGERDAPIDGGGTAFLQKPRQAKSAACSSCEASGSCPG
jgi:hypothetical protein